jgi:hypothetical protein
MYECGVQIHMAKFFGSQLKQSPVPGTSKPTTPQNVTAKQTDQPSPQTIDQSVVAFQQRFGNRKTNQLIQRLRAQNTTTATDRRVVQRLFSLQAPEKTSQLDTYIGRKGVPIEDAPKIAKLLITRKTLLKGLLGAVSKSGGSNSESESSDKPDPAIEIEALLVEENLANVTEAVEAMIVSSVDEGVFNIDNDQQLVLFYNKVRQWLTADQMQKPIDSSKEAESEKSFDDTMWSSYQTLVASYASSADGGSYDKSKVFKTAVLGAGASAAYYLVNAASTLDFESTVVIGNLQPWAGERGAMGSINHPHNMINPEYQDEAINPDGGLAFRAEFSKVLADLFAKLGDKRFLPIGVKSVLKKNTGHGTYYYRIETDEGVVYAQNVIAAMGIGKHKLPDNVTAEMIENSGTLDDAPTDEFKKKKDEESGPKFKRIMSLDEFQRMIDGLKKGSRKLSEVAKSVAIIGPNASIDAMTSVLRQQDEALDITWVSGAREPPFLPGTDNSFTKGKYREVAQGKNKQTETTTEAPVENTARRPATTEVFKDGNITIVKHDFVGMTPGTDKVDVLYGSRNDKTPYGTRTVDIAVYGMGPDESGLRGTFKDKDQDALKNLAPIYDINQRVNTQGTPLEKLKEKLGTKLGSVENILELKPIVRAKDPVGQWLPSVVGFQVQNESEDDQTSMQLIGGTGSRLGAKVEYKFISQSLEAMHEDFNAMLLTDWMEFGFNQTEKGLLNQLVTAEAKYVIKARKAAGLLEGWKPSKTLSDERDNVKRLELAKLETKDVESIIAECNILRQGIKDAFKAALQGIDRSRWRDNVKTRQVGDVYLKKLWGFARQFKKAQSMLEEYLNKRQNGTTLDQFGAQAVSFMSTGIINTLPNNVLLPDQLTPSRSGIEVLQNAMPTTVTSGINFITSDNTIIAMHIAGAYTEIPDLLADYVTERIIYDRRQLADDKAPLPQSKDLEDPNASFNLQKQVDFQKQWATILEKLNSLF